MIKILNTLNYLLSLDTYILVDVAIGATTLLLFLRLIRTYNKDKSNIQNRSNLNFTLFLAAVVGNFTFLDLIWEATYIYPTYNRTVFEVVNILYYFAFIIVPYVWFWFTLNCYERIKKSFAFIAPTVIPFAINLTLVILTIINNHTLWTIGDSANKYMRGDLAWFSTLVNMWYLFAPLVELTYLRVVKKRKYKIGYWSIVLFSLIPLFGMALYRFVLTSEQVDTFPFQPFSSFIGIVFAYFFIVEEANEDKVKEIIREKKVIETLASQYSYMFYVNLATGAITPYGSSNYYLNHVKPFLTNGGGIQEAFTYYVNNLVYEEDRERLLKEGNVERLIENLQHQKSCNLIYRIKKEAGPEYLQMTIVKSDEIDEPPTSLTMAITDKNDEVINKYIDAELVNVYSTLAYIDLEQGRIKIIKISNEIGATRETDVSYSNMYKKISSLISPKYEDQLAYVNSPEAIKEFLNDIDSREIIFEFRGMERSLRQSEWKVLERINGIPHIVLLCVRPLDDESAKRFELNRIIEAQNKELSAAKAHADAASAAKSQFLFNMSHDIRTPMNAILGYTNMAEKSLNSPNKVKDYLGKINIAGQHLLTLINEVLDMSRIETGNIEITKDPVNVITKATETIEICKELANAKKIDLSIITKNVHNPNVLADALHVDQIITNVISNAIKYTHEGGKVLFTIEETRVDINSNKVWFKFTVADNGIGMKPEFLRTIFDSFAREKNTTLSGVEGTGLGMSIVKQLVDILSGTINIESTVNVGTKVIIELPFELQATTAFKEIDVSETVLSDLSEKRILLVEDNAMNREIATFILEDLNATVEEAEDGDIAVEKLKSNDIGYYDFVLMDIQMPRMNGYDATKAIREFDKKTPIVAMTANAFEEDKRKALNVGMNAHIAKPVESDILLATLSSLS